MPPKSGPGVGSRFEQIQKQTQQLLGNLRRNPTESGGPQLLISRFIICPTFIATPPQNDHDPSR
jgi:hypothetical protein